MKEVVSGTSRSQTVVPLPERVQPILPEALELGCLLEFSLWKPEGLCNAEFTNPWMQLSPGKGIIWGRGGAPSFRGWSLLERVNETSTTNTPAGGVSLEGGQVVQHSTHSWKYNDQNVVCSPLMTRYHRHRKIPELLSQTPRSPNL